MGARVSSGSGSLQTYSTPDDFMAAVHNRFGTPTFDLAATLYSAKAPSYYTEADGALKQEWAKLGGLLWLNPPYRNIGQWSSKCVEESRKGAQILFLVPVSVSDWFVKDVVHHADIYLLHGRLSFDGKSPYPKDCMLCHYHPVVDDEFHTYIWTWRNDISAQV